jgi:hypothetical protein
MSVQRCGGNGCSCEAEAVEQRERGGIAAQRSAASHGSPTVQRVVPALGAAALAMLTHCLLGVASTLAFDALLWGIKRLLTRSKEKLLNKCKILLSVLVGCVFGVAGGAVKQWLIAQGIWAVGGVIETLKQTLKGAVIQQLLGKWGLIFAKLGCPDSRIDSVPPKKAEDAKPELAEILKAGESGEGVAEPHASGTEAAA